MKNLAAIVDINNKYESKGGMHVRGLRYIADDQCDILVLILACLLS